MSCAIAAGAVLLSSCVASSVDTAGFNAASGVSATEQVLALETSTLPNPTVRPSADLTSGAAAQETPVAVAATSETPATSAPEASALVAQAPQADTAPATPPAPVQVADAQTTAPETDVANQRIASAANAPTVESAGAQPTTNTQPPVAVAAAAPASAPEPQAALAPASEPRKRTGLFAALFNNKPEPKAPVAKSAAAKTVEKPLVTASTSTANRERAVIATASARGSLSPLPGVDKKRAMGISEVEQDDSEEYEVASAGGLARLAPNGLKTQHDGVDVKCLKPALVRVLKQVERKYGKSAIVTSGYRSPSHNKRVRGAKKSLHMYCAAADIQVPGVTKWELASYMRSMPGRGGVGTYCHTNSVHVDIGPRRDWNWRCRRR